MSKKLFEHFMNVSLARFVVGVLFLSSAGQATFGKDSDSFDSRIILKSGVEIPGRVTSEFKQNGRRYIVFETLSGTVFKLDRGRVVKSVISVSEELKKYREELRSVGDSADDHWAMYHWCKNNGRASRLGPQMKYHLHRIVEIDPTDATAWQILKYTQVDGRWIPETQYFESLGYVKYKGKWIPEIRASQIEAEEQADQWLSECKKNLRDWKNNTLNRKSPDIVRDELLSIVDSRCLKFFHDRFLVKEKNPELRILFLEAVGQVNNSMAEQILVAYSMEDGSADVRDHAFSLLENGGYSKDSVAKNLSVYLTNSNNRVVNRAGTAIGILNSETTLVPLISALQTTHKYATGSDPGRMNTRFDSNGGVGFSTGGGPKFVVRNRKNEGVLVALNKITGEDFRFDTELWKKWYLSNHSLVDIQMRRGGR